MRKTYYIPTTEIVPLLGLNPLQMGDWSDKGTPSLPAPRRDPKF